MFGDIHRFLMQKHSDIEYLKEVHIRKDKLCKEAIADCERKMSDDTSERTSQITKFSENMKTLTNRKAVTLHKDMMDQDIQIRRGDNVLQFQIDRLVRELDSFHDGLCIVADAMEDMAIQCAPEQHQESLAMGALICPKCGNEFMGDALFCRKCGNQRPTRRASRLQAEEVGSAAGRYSRQQQPVVHGDNSQLKKRKGGGATSSSTFR